ncbi:hypothetical protein IMCC3088_1713 [Aequoribacter fuscus]|uniref:Uncharacterized protein n=1 Tax=Aequoribacter fuscus TaxID=2518989 RepID=F3L2E6_9GAMM|nr:hypothetical protein IMCC3088_1713 [Aequoribacter fuscus]
MCHVDCAPISAISHCFCGFEAKSDGSKRGFCAILVRVSANMVH